MGRGGLDGGSLRYIIWFVTPIAILKTLSLLINIGKYKARSGDKPVDLLQLKLVIVI